LPPLHPEETAGSTYPGPGGSAGH